MGLLSQTLKRKFLIVLLLIMILLLVCGYYNTRAELSDFRNQVLKFDLKEQKFLETISEDGTFLAEQEQIILSQKDAIANNLLEIKRLKKIKSQVIVNTITHIDSVFVPFVSDSTFSDTILEDNYIIIPQKFALTDEWYGIKGNILKGGLLIDTLSFSNELSLTIGSKSMGLFKKPKPIVLVEYSNPYVSTQSMQNIIIKDELRFYDKKSFWYGAGVVSGVITSVILIK